MRRQTTGTGGLIAIYAESNQSAPTPDSKDSLRTYDDGLALTQYLGDPFGYLTGSCSAYAAAKRTAGLASPPRCLTGR